MLCFSVVVCLAHHFVAWDGWTAVHWPRQPTIAVNCHQCFSRNISPTFGALSYFWQTLEELECHGPVMSEQTRVELEQKIDEARESIRKAEVRKQSLGTSVSYHGMVCAAAV